MVAPEALPSVNIALRKSFCTPTTWRRQERPGNAEAEHPVDADHREALLLPQGQRVPSATRRRTGSAQPTASTISTSRTTPRTTVLLIPEDEGLEDHAEPEEHCDNRDQPEPDAQGESSGLLAAGDELGRTGEHERHQHQHEGPAELDAAGAGLRTTLADEWCATGKGGSHGEETSRGRGGRVGADKYHQPHASQEPRRAGIPPLRLPAWPATCPPNRRSAEAATHHVRAVFR